jgi:hypothetical protein
VCQWECMYVCLAVCMSRDAMAALESVRDDTERIEGPVFVRVVCVRVGMHACVLCCM